MLLSLGSSGMTFNRIVVAYDGSEEARRALATAVDLSACLQAELISVTVQEDAPIAMREPMPLPVSPESATAEIERASRELDLLLLEAEEIAAAKGVCLTATRTTGDEVEGILDSVSVHDCDLLVLGMRHHSGIIDRLLSHTASTLAERAPCSVLGVR